MVARLFMMPCMFLLGSVAARAQDAKLAPSARKEGGKVVPYGSSENTAMHLITQAFEKKGGIAVESYRASATKTMDRAFSELRATKAPNETNTRSYF